MTVNDIISVISPIIMILVFFAFIKANKDSKKIKVSTSGIEIENKTDADRFEVINPGDACPYDKAYTATRNEIRGLQEEFNNSIKQIGANISALGSKMDFVIKEMNDMDTMQLKILFRSTGQPPEDRLLAGLKYVHKGEDGEMGKAVVSMALKWRDMYEAICAVKPEYRIESIDKEEIHCPRGNEGLCAHHKKHSAGNTE